MALYFLDTETTGGGEADRLIQLAVKEYAPHANTGVFTHNELYLPPVPITIDSMTVHHITPARVAGRPLFMASEEYPALKARLEDPNALVVAHNAAFDLAMLAREGITPAQSICTLKASVALDTDEAIPSHRLQYLRYYLGLDVAAHAHDAWDDVLVLEALFTWLLAEYTKVHGSEEKALQEMRTISQRPRLFTRFRFGKYNGERVGDIATRDSDYLRWLLKEKQKQPALEADWIATLEHHLGLG